MIAFGAPRSLPRRFTGTIEELLPQAANVPGWVVANRPVAETAELQRATTEILNYDDAICSIYTHSQTRISVYVAYWGPGKMAHRLVAGHTPDVCWVAAGWVPNKACSVELRTGSGEIMALDRSRKARREKDVGGEAEERAGEDVETLSRKLSAHRPECTSGLQMQYRVFRLGEETEYVVFCHLVDGRFFIYGDGGRPPWYGFIADVWRYGSRQCEEQLFLRISCNRPLEEFKDAPPVQYFLQRLSVELEKMRRSSGDERS